MSTWCIYEPAPRGIASSTAGNISGIYTSWSWFIYYTFTFPVTIIIVTFIDNWEKVNYPFTRPLVSGAYNDIQDGERYKRQSQPGKFFSVPEHTGLILCADGVPLFKSSGLCSLHAYVITVC